MKTKVVSIVLMLSLLVSLAFVSDVSMAEEAGNTEARAEAKYVFYFIGDGMGAAQRQLAEYYLQAKEDDTEAKLLINKLPQTAINTTHSADTLITDSAAAGTALACGVKTNNGVIAQLPDGTDVETLQEAAEAAGMATGVASTTRVTHATPASFISHNIARGDENGIAVDMIDSGVDYLVGGGLRHFVPGGFKDVQADVFGSTIKSKRTDDRNLFAEFKQAGYIAEYGAMGAKQFESYEPKAGDRYVNLFSYSHMPYTIDAINSSEYDVPSLADMTKKGIELLSQDEDGFFFMIEGGRIDHACHPNDAAAAIQDTLAFDDAVAQAYDFYLDHPEETLIVVVGDHETGGLGMGVNTDYFMNLTALDSQKASIADWYYGSTAAEGDLDAITADMETLFGISELKDFEIEELEAAIKRRDNGIQSRNNNAYNYNEVGIAVAHIASERAGVYWTSFAHTGTQIPMSAIGVGASNYRGFIDNTDIADLTAANMGIELAK